MEVTVTHGGVKKTGQQLNPYPNGWFVVEFSEKLQKGEIRSLTFMGQNLVLYRTASGKVAASDAYCPHLGAHFAHGGKIIGEELQCPFHGFRFDCNGSCTSSGYNTKGPPKAQLKQWPVDERNGLISIFYDPQGKAPDWELPTMDMRGWTPYITSEYDLNIHPQETTENIVDVGHFQWIHGYRQITEERAAEINGPLFQATYGFSRTGRELGRRGDIRVYIRASAYGLGFSCVDTHVPQLGIRTKNFVLPTPTSNGMIRFRLALAVKSIESSYKVHPLAGLLPRKWLTYILRKAAFNGYVNDLEDDFKIWQHKVYIENPPIAKGDGPIPLYRKWAKQFYYQQMLEA